MSNPASVSRPTETERELPSLPQVDTSRQAWAFVFASFLVETLLWGPLNSNGVFLKEYASLQAFATSSETKISLIGTLSLFLGYAAGLPLLYIYNRYPQYMKPSIWGGLVLYTASLLSASFVDSMDLLIVFQGIGPGLAAALCAFPIIRWLPEWFDKRRGLAGGFIFSGGGVGGVYMPIFFQFVIDRLGHKWTLRISALITAAVAGLAIPFVNPRIPLASTAHTRQMPMPPLLSTFLRVGFFGCFLCTLLQAFGFFNVGLFLPRFSDTLDATAGAGLLSAFNVSCIFAQLLWGFLTDRMKASSAMALSSTLGCLFVLTMWGFGGGIGLAVLAPFAVVFGVFTGGFTSMWSQSAYNIAGPDKEQQTMLFSGFSIARGLGAALGPTIGAELYRQPSTAGPQRWGSAGSPGLVALVAASLAGSAIVGLLFAHARTMWEIVTKSRDDEGVQIESEGFEMAASGAGAGAGAGASNRASGG
ncbi:hypothetical protein JCM24511_00469 [Saitozyma sp. JCM 24511]|nr:hypothetical protein JCM24511_00469 [Saitozyma sp. JCM 24511]